LQSHLGWLTAALISISCGSSSANGTTFFIRVAWQDAWGVQQLRFAGATSSATAFPTSDRPTSPESSLSSPQSVRVLLSPDLDGQTVNVTVAGLDGTGTVVATGSAMEQVQKDQEVSFLIELMQGGAGGGSGTGGGSASTGGGSGHTGGGTAPMGGGSAGGMGGGSMGTGGGTVVMSCNCPGGCCASGKSSCEVGVGIFFTCSDTAVCTHSNGIGTGTCGSSDSCNNVCDLRTADSCGMKGCQCGNQQACGDGMLCYGGQCFCTALTCSGCCTPDAGQCITSPNPQQCGIGGATCVACDGGAAGVGCSAGVCSVLSVAKCTDPLQCLSGDECVDAGAPPRCIATATGVCYFCDPVTSDRCRPDMNPRCGCGANAPCSDGSICVKTDGGHLCVSGTYGN
jgi:hypothetical protein